MNEFWGLALIFVPGILLITFIIWSSVSGSRAEKARNTALFEVARRLGLSFDPEAEFTFPPELGKISLLKSLVKTRARKPIRFLGLSIVPAFVSVKAKNILYGRVNGSDVIVFDYVFPTEDGESTTTIACVQLSKTVPDFRLTYALMPTFTKIAEFFGASNITFPSQPAFAEYYRLQAADESAVRTLFQPHVLHYFMENKRAWSVEAAGNWLAVYFWQRALPAETLSMFLQEARHIAQLFVDQHSSSTGVPTLSVEGEPSQPFDRPSSKKFVTVVIFVAILGWGIWQWAQDGAREASLNDNQDNPIPINQGRPTVTSLQLKQRAKIKEDTGDFKGAIEDYTQVLKLYPQEDWAYAFRGWAKNSAGDFSGGIDDYTEFLRRHPEDDWSYINRGFAKMNLGDFQGATNDFTAAITNNPKLADAYIRRSSARERLGDFHGMLEDAAQVIALQPNNALGFNNRGWAKWNLGDSQGAIGDLTEAIKLDPKNALAYRNRAIIKENIGDSAGAQDDRAQVEALNR